VFEGWRRSLRKRVAKGGLPRAPRVLAVRRHLSLRLRSEPGGGRPLTDAGGLRLG
jgi:hypothetical protein